MAQVSAHHFFNSFYVDPLSFPRDGVVIQPNPHDGTRYFSLRLMAPHFIDVDRHNAKEAKATEGHGRKRGLPPLVGD